MFRSFSLGLSIVFMFTAHLTFACKNNYYHGHGKNGCCKNIHVNGYYKKKGTYVSEHYRCSSKNIKIFFVNH